MKWKWRRTRKAPPMREAAQLREQAEAAEHEAHVTIRVPLRQLRERNHVVEDIVKIIRRGTPGAGGAQ